MDISGEDLVHIIVQYNRNFSDYNDNIRRLLDIARDRRIPPLSSSQRPSIRSRPPLYTGGFLDLFRDNVMQDVVVRPTDEQIRTATETIFFESNATENTNCPITLEPFVQGESICRIKHCSHIFKQEAIHDWFHRNVRCPVCRYDIREYEEEDEFNDVVQELIQEQIQEDTGRQERQSRQGRQQVIDEDTRRIQENTNTNRRIQDRPSLSRTFTNVLRNFVSNVSNEIDLPSAATELLYTFEIPITYDISSVRFSR